MWAFVAKRFFQAVVTLLLVVTAVFLLGRVIGDPVVLLLPETATEEDLKVLSRLMGLDRPIPVQYFDYLGDLARLDLGNSLLAKGYSVQDIIRPALWNSFQLAVVAFAISIATGVPLGILAAVKRNTMFDYLARVIALMGQVVPPWWLGIVVIFIFAAQLELLPPAGMGGIDHIIMPASVIGLFAMAGIARLTRSSMLEVLDSEFVKLARAKGLPNRVVLWKHALRNALIPVITFGGIFFGSLVGGAIVVEVVFAWPGLGRVMFDALSQRDFPTMQGAILVGAIIIITFNFLVDILYGWIDPRMTHST